MDDDDDLEVLQNALDVAWQSGDGASLSGGGHMVSVVDGDGTAWKCSNSSPS